MQYQEDPTIFDYFGYVMNAQQSHSSDGRLFGLFIARCIEIDDPLKLRRIKVVLHWGEENENEFKTDWIKQWTPHTGPTHIKRGKPMVWGMDLPVPEINSDVMVFFNGGDVHDGYYFGGPRYAEMDRLVPGLEKDSDIDRSFRWRFPNGTEIAIGTEGDVHLTIAGDLDVKAMGSVNIKSRRIMNLVSTYVRAGALAVVRIIAPQFSHERYPTQDDGDIMELYKELSYGIPGEDDPGIPKPPRLE